MSSSCRSVDSLHYLDSWNKHCGGDWGEFASRTITITDSIVLAFAAVNLNRVSSIFGRGIAASLIAKSANDTYEAWSGHRGPLRNAMGDNAYLAVDAALITYGFLKQAPRINYLGNPAHDFFVKDPLSYEYAFKQYSKFELGHAFLGAVNSFHDDDRWLENRIFLEQQWENHLNRLHSDDN